VPDPEVMDGPAGRPLGGPPIHRSGSATSSTLVFLGSGLTM